MADIDYAPRTDLGQGILPSLVRAHTHTLTVFTAVAHDWPMTVEQATAELAEATNHVAQMPAIDALLGDEAIAAVGIWKEKVTGLTTKLTTAETTNPDTPVSEFRDDLKHLATQTFALLELLDKDLCGLNDNATDAGRLP